MVFSVITRVVQPLPQSSLEHFHHPRRKPHTHQQSFLISAQSSQPQATSNLFFVSVDLPTVDISVMESYIVWCQVGVQVIDLRSFKIQVFTTINFHLSTTLAASRKFCCIVSSFSFISKCFQFFLCGFFLSYIGYWQCVV